MSGDSDKEAQNTGERQEVNQTPINQADPNYQAGFWAGLAAVLNGSVPSFRQGPDGANVISSSDPLPHVPLPPFPPPETLPHGDSFTAESSVPSDIDSFGFAQVQRASYAELNETSEQSSSFYRGTKPFGFEQAAATTNTALTSFVPAQLAQACLITQYDTLPMQQMRHKRSNLETAQPAQYVPQVDTYDLSSRRISRPTSPAGAAEQALIVSSRATPSANALGADEVSVRELWRGQKNSISSGKATQNRVQISQKPKRFAEPFVGADNRVTKGGTQGRFRAFGSQRSKFDPKSRAMTALTREAGACAACRRNKLRCNQSSKDKFVPCERCAKKPVTLLSEPCCRIELIHIKLFRLEGSPDSLAKLGFWMKSKQPGSGTLLLQNGKMEHERPRRIKLMQDVTTTTFEVTVSRFQIGPEDTTAYKWTDSAGVQRQYSLPPYYISDLADAGTQMRQYAKNAAQEFVVAFTSGANPIIQKTIREAQRYYGASNSPLVGAALLFWSATRMIERFWIISGPDLLGVPPMTENIGPCRRNPFVDGIPVTPVMDTQLDGLAIGHVLIPLKNKLLEILNTKILQKKKENWYEIYLASFIILHNSERVLDHVVDFGKRFGVRPSPRSNGETSLSHAYYHACKTLLAYFHFACGGAAPLSLDPMNHTVSAHNGGPIMDQHQVAYLVDMRNEMVHQENNLQSLKGRSMYEAEMYWCHQMLFPDWKADLPHLGDFLEFTEKDFLVT